MSFLSLHKRRSSKSLSRKDAKSVADSFATAPSSPEHEALEYASLSDIDLSPLPSPGGSIRRKLQRKKSSSTTKSSGEPGRPKAFHWPTGDPSRPSGTINFDFSPPPSPELSPSKDRWSFLSSFNPEPESPVRQQPRPKSVLADWFQGESAPVNLGLVASPTTEVPDDMAADLRPTFLKRTSTLSNGRPTSPAKSLSSQNTGRFGFFTSAAKALSSGVIAVPPAPQESDERDEFLQLDIKAALQPSGEADPFSPSSFKNLLQDAEGLLTRMQSAYQQRVMAVADARAELSAQQEEKDEAATRTQHLKQQLNDLSSENAQKDEVINELLAELKAEKRLRQEEMEAKVRTVKLVDMAPRKLRGSRQSTDSSIVSDSGFESNNDEDHETPSLTSSASLASLNSSPRLGHARQTSVTKASPTIIHNVSAPRLEKPGTPFASEATRAMIRGADVSNISSCRGCDKCGGMNSNAAWGVVTNLRDENHALRDRNKHVEAELEGVLGMVNGLLGS